MQWVPCMQQFCSLESPMLLLCNLWYLLKDLFLTEKELQGCIQLYHLLLDWSVLASLSYILVFLPISKLTILVHKIAIFFFCNFVFTHFLHIFSPLNCLSQVVIELPYVFFQTLIYGSLFYSMACFEWTVMKFVWYIFFMFFTLLYFTYFGMMVTAMTPNHNVAPILAAPFYMMWNLFCGFMIPHKVMSHSVFSISIGYAI